MEITRENWKQYIENLAKADDKAAELITDYLSNHEIFSDKGFQAFVDYFYAVVTKYAEGAAEMACQAYETQAEVQGVAIKAAIPAIAPTYGEVIRSIRGTMLSSDQPKVLGQTAGRLVRQIGVDTTLNNALRDGAEWAWIPSGDTCSFCLMLASNGWQRASKKALKNGHARHIHPNCDCTYAVRFDGKSGVEGYDPDAYRKMYDSAEGHTRKEKVNAMRRAKYAQNKDRINAQKRAAYRARKDKDIIAISMNDGIMNAKIASPIESRAHPTGKAPGVAISGDPINARQQRILDKLPGYDSKYIFNKRDVSMKDLAALTAHENVEFAMFTRREERLVIRGERNSVNISRKDARELSKQGYKWSGHTHPAVDYYSVLPSDGDRIILSEMGHKYSSIHSSTGRKYVFAVNEYDDIGRKE